MNNMWLDLGPGGVVAAARIIAVTNPDSEPIARAVREARARHLSIDLTYGRRTRTVLFLDTGHIVLAGIAMETVMERLNDRRPRTADGRPIR